MFDPAVDRGEDVRCLSIPIYEGNTLMSKGVTLKAKGVTLKARGTNGFSLDVTIVNKK